MSKINTIKMSVMKKSIESLINEIKIAFPTLPIQSFFDKIAKSPYPLADKTLGIAEETFIIHEGIRNKTWDKVTPEYYEKEWGFMDWLTPYGIYYYLPGVMIYALGEYTINNGQVTIPTHVDLILSTIFNPMDDDVLNYFNDIQLDLLIEWANTLMIEI